MIRKLAVCSTIAALTFLVPVRASDIRRVVTGVQTGTSATWR
jgi:hypothetical protein